MPSGLSRKAAHAMPRGKMLKDSGTASSGCRRIPASAAIRRTPVTIRHWRAGWKATCATLGLDNVQNRPRPATGRLRRIMVWVRAEISPTVLVYGHYDVVRALMEDGWHTDPFEPTERDGRNHARGVDDQRPTLHHIKDRQGRVLPQKTAAALALT